jgi:hypothetical protein
MIFTLITSPSESPLKSPKKPKKAQKNNNTGFPVFLIKKPNRTETGRFEPVPVRVRFEFLSFSKFDFG